MVERYPMTPFVAAKGSAIGFATVRDVALVLRLMAPLVAAKGSAIGVATVRATVRDVALVRNSGPYGCWRRSPPPNGPK